jgi:hypothetical protein
MATGGNTSTNVTACKPKIKGAVFVAPLGTTIPTDATSTLDNAFECCGYISDAGVVNTNTASTTAVKAWGGDTVFDIQTEKPDQWKLTFIEHKNIAVLKTVYGSENVTGDLDTGITITANSKDLDTQIFVIDMLLRDNTAKRVVLPVAKVASVGDITYSDSAAVGYETTLGCYPDEDGNTHYEYIIKTEDPSI